MEQELLSCGSGSRSEPPVHVYLFLLKDAERTLGEGLERKSWITLERCIERYRLAALYLVCYAVTIAGTLDMGNARGKALAEALLGRCLRSLDELDAWRLLD